MTEDFVSELMGRLLPVTGPPKPTGFPVLLRACVLCSGPLGRQADGKEFAAEVVVKAAAENDWELIEREDHVEAWATVQVQATGLVGSNPPSISERSDDQAPTPDS